MLVTFIIPTIGRESLKRALESLQAQTDPDWQAIVAADQGWQGPRPVRDTLRIQYVGHSPVSSAGATRNFGLMMLLEVISGPRSEWIGFLDDDDRLKPTYVEHLREAAEDHPWAECVISRMNHPQLGVLPPPNGILRQGSVGISFAARWKIFEDGLRFERERVDEMFHEDWQMIHALQTSGKKIFLSPHCDYLVRDAN